MSCHPFPNTYFLNVKKEIVLLDCLFYPLGNDFTNPTIAKSGFRVHWPFLHMYGGIFASFKYLTGDTYLSYLKSHCPGIFTYKNANPEKADRKM